MYLHKKYLDTSVSNVKIKLGISFNRETTNWATSEAKKVGYQVTAVPVEVMDMEGGGGRWESSVAFTGFNDCLLEIGRQSKKRLEKAIEVLNANEARYKEFFEAKGIKFES